MTEPIRDGDVVLLVGHGTVFELEDLPAFLLKIRRGRPAPRELVEDLHHRYSAIGGSPLLSTTEEVARLVELELGQPVRVAMRLWDPLIADVLAQLDLGSTKRIIVVPVAPFSVHIYGAAVIEALGDSPLAGVEVRVADPYGTHPQLTRAWVDRIRPQLGAGETLLLTAHSLPVRAIQAGDPYQQQVEAAAAAVGAALGLKQGEFHLAYQSQGASGGAWLGPDLEETFDRLRGGGTRRIVLAPIGFLSDHVETLYDLDIEAQAWARDRDLELARVPALNTDAGLIATLADVARAAGS